MHSEVGNLSPRQLANVGRLTIRWASLAKAKLTEISLVLFTSILAAAQHSSESVMKCHVLLKLHIEIYAHIEDYLNMNICTTFWRPTFKLCDGNRFLQPDSIWQRSLGWFHLNLDPGEHEL